MPENRFIRFFDKEGNDMNLGATSMPLVSLYDSTTLNFDYYQGGIYFPKVSVNLIESQQLFLLQEVTGPTSSYELRKITGEATVISGDPTITGEGSDFTTLEVGYTIKVLDEDFTISSISGPTSMMVTPTPDFNSTTFDIYYYDYLSYTQPRSSIGTFRENIEVDFLPLGSSVSTTQFFLYDVNYSQDAPFIEKFYLSEIEIADGSSDTEDPLTGRVDLAVPVTVPTQINLGFSSDTEYNYEQDLVINSVQAYQEPLTSTPTFSTTFTFTIGGTGYPLYDITEFYLQGVTGAGATATFYNQKLAVISVTSDGTDTFIETKPINFSSTAYSNYRIYFVNKLPIAKLHLYGETEGEDERFRMVLQNFGRSINSDSEYIFRESDISEDLSNFEILNKKRKELLLEGDNIYPYLGSYRALINIINFFGYYDLRIKEYFLNVDGSSSNFGKYLHLLIPRDEAQRKEVKKSWQIVPSKIYKKTSLFGLFYDLNRATDEEDIYGIPVVEDAFDFSPEEVLIKLFGLKEVLKKEFLPLNARIYDITGEGIYFERIRIDSWADNLQYFSLDLGKRPEFKIYPDVAYVSDLRRMDSFYVSKFVEQQGLTGFLGPSASDPGLTALGYTGPLQSLETTNIISYSYFLDTIYDSEGELLPPVDNSWDYMPPGISNPDFNTIASRLRPLPDEEGIVSGGPALLEAFFDISWEESYFTWAQLGILGPTGAPLNINIWTWESIGRGEYTELRWTVQKSGFNGFNYDSGRRPITDYVVETRGATAFAIPARMRANVSGGSFVDIDLLSAGYGYTASPAIYIPSPDQAGGTPATATCTVSDGYVTSITFTAGSGYSYAPTITVEPPGVTYEPVNRILNAIALPYEGEYDVGLYIYDICNNYTVEFQKYSVKNKQADFVSSFRRETSERTWEDFNDAPPSVDFDSGLTDLITWKEVNGPWYYPIHVKSSWSDAEISWESLNFSRFKDQSLFEYSLNSSIFKIDRDAKYVVLSGNLTGNLNNLSSLNVGDYLFLERYESDLIEENLSISSIPTNLTGEIYGVNVNILNTSNNPLFGQPGSQRIIVNAFVNQAQIQGQTITLINAAGQTNSRTVVGIQANTPSAGLTRINFATTFTYNFSQAAGGYFVWGDPQGILTGNVSMTTAVGSTVVSTVPWNTTNYLNSNDRVYIIGSGGWRIVDTVGPTSFSVTVPYESGISGATGFSYSGDTMQLQLNYSSATSIDMNRYSRLVITDDCKYTSLNPSTDFYQFVDGLTFSATSITVTGTDEAIQSIILENNLYGSDLHATWGVFSGTYALEITNISLTGSNTLFRLKDDSKELYYLDGNFSPRFADYDVDYAETRIGFDSLNFENLDETTWEENRALTWYGAEYHGGSLCGFLIPFAAPGGNITIDENPTFVFSGDQSIDSTKQGLEIAAAELIASQNSGISLYEYSVLPETELYITDISGLPTDVAADTPPGSTTIVLNSTPFGRSLKIPARLTVLFNVSGAVTSVFIADEGWGYDSPPTVTLITSSCISNEAVITCTLGDGGYVASVSIVNAGSGYVSTQTTVEVTTPTNFKEYDNYVWTGNEWVEVTGVNTGYNYQIQLGTALQYEVPGGTFLLLPYDYHKQVFLKPETFQQFYYFIQAKSISPSTSSLSYVNMGDGVQSEWAQHPDRSYSYPLRNSLYFLAMNDQADLSQDYLYNNWIYEGSDYPPVSVPPIYESNVLSYSSRLPFSQSLQGCFSFIDTVISSSQKRVPQCTPVVFHFDKCAIPGKNNPLWTITDEEETKVVVMSQEDKLAWNFTRPGSFTVSLTLRDANGNISSTSKNSFIVVDGN